MAEDASDDNEEVSPLKFKPGVTTSTPFKKLPRFRRHKSEPAAHFEKLGIFQLDQKQIEDAKDQDDTDNVSLPVNISAFSPNPKQFASELKTMIESIQDQKELPPKSVIKTLLNVLNYWIINHGITTIDELEQYTDKYELMQSEHIKQTITLQQQIDEYKNEYNEYQTQKESFDNNNMELAAKLIEAEQQLKSASFLKQKIINLEKELERKTTENDKNLKQRTIQQKQINTITTDKMQLQKIIDSQKLKVSTMNSMDNELKNKTNKIREMKKKYTEIELELEQITIEKEELYKEKKELQCQLHDYGQLQANLGEYEMNETEHMQTIQSLNDTIIELREESVSKSNQSLHQLTEEDEAKQVHEHVETAYGNEMTFIDFTDEVRTYNTYVTGNNNEVVEVGPKFDDELKKEFDISIGNDVNVEGMAMDDEKKEEIIEAKKSIFTSRTAYRSFVIVGVSCLCYFIYSQYWNGKSWQRAKEIKDRYRKWQKKKVVKK